MDPPSSECSSSPSGSVTLIQAHARMRGAVRGKRIGSYRVIKTFTWCTGAHSSRAFCSGEQGHAPAAAGARESMGWEGGAPKWLLGKLVGHVTSTKMQKTVSLLTHKPRAHCTHTAHAATLPSPSTGPKSVRSSLLAAVFVVDGCHCFPTGCRPNPMALETPQVRAHRP